MSHNLKQFIVEVQHLAQLHGVSYVVAASKDMMSAHNSEGDLVLVMGLTNTLKLSHDMLYQKEMANHQIRKIVKGGHDDIA